MKISIGIPVKNEADNIPILKNQLSELLNSPKYSEVLFEVIVNDNLSDDGSSELLEQWHNQDSRVKIYRLQQPLEFQETIINLMQKASGDCFALLQSDLQDPVNVLEQMIDTWLPAQTFVVAGCVKEKDEFFPVFLARKIFYFILHISSDKQYESGFQDFYVLPKYVYNQIANLPRQGIFIRGYINYFFSRIKYVNYKRENRKHGSTKFNFAKMYDLALDGLLLYGRRFIRMLSILSFGIFILSTFGLITILILGFAGFDPGIKGWMSLAAGLTLILSIFGIVSGIILEYLIRIHRSIQLRAD